MGRVNTFHSRRTYYDKATFWIRDERNQTGNPSQWIVYNQPTGQFYCKQVAAKTNQENVINGTWMVDRDIITLETNDCVDDITRGTIVKFRDELWIVESVQTELHLKESQFHKGCIYTYFINMRK